VTLKTVKKGLAFLFAVIFSFTSLSCSQTFAATVKKSDTASTLYLSKTTGTVIVKNNVGAILEIPKGGQLFSGYTITTSAQSYATISLGEGRSVLLDCLTSAEIRQTGPSRNNELNVLVKSGKIVFDIEKQLEKNEKLTVRTSNLTTAIRGTVGLVNSHMGTSKQTSYCATLSGKATCYTNTLQDTIRSLNYSNGVSDIRYYTATVGQVFTVKTDVSEIAPKRNISTSPEDGDSDTENSALETKKARIAVEKLPGFAKEVIASKDTVKTALSEKLTKVSIDDAVKDYASAKSAEKTASAEKLTNIVKLSSSVDAKPTKETVSEYNI